MTTAPSKPAPAPRDETGTIAGAHAGLDVLLTDVAVGGGTRRFIQPRAVASVVARHPRRMAGRARTLASELVRVGGGASEQEPPKGDRRFTDPARQRNWLLPRVMPGYLAVGATVDGVITDAELDWQTERQARFAASNVIDALAPTNFPWSNPVVLRAIVDRWMQGRSQEMIELMEQAVEANPGLPVWRAGLAPCIAGLIAARTLLRCSSRRPPTGSSTCRAISRS